MKELSRHGSIAVIVPAHNGARFYDAAFESILGQKMDVEIIVIDDGSTDNLAERISLRGGPVQLLRQQRQGPAAARNLGIRHSSATLIAFLDIDDRWEAGHLERLSAVLEGFSDAGYAQGSIRQFAEDGEGRMHFISGPYRMPYLGSCLFRRETLEARGLLDGSMQFGEDYDLIVRCWENDVPRACVDEVSLLYRRHAGNMTHRNNPRASLAVLQRRMSRIRRGAIDPAAPRRFVFADYVGEIANFAVPPARSASLCQH